MGITENIKRLSKFVRGKLAERDFDKNVRQILSDPSFDKTENIFQFRYEGKQIKIKIPDVKDHISYEICSKRKFFGFENLEDLRQFIRPGSVIIDAGANIGNHSLFFALICGASKVFSFEPQSDIYKILETNVRINGCDEKILTFRKALGETDGYASIDFREDVNVGARKILNTGGVFIKEDSSGDFELTTLDKVMHDKIVSLDFIKIDVQGFENKLLKGAAETIKKYRPLIYLEVTTLKELNEIILPIMDSLGYKLKKAYTIDYLFENYLP